MTAAIASRRRRLRNVGMAAVLVMVAIGGVTAVALRKAADEPAPGPEVAPTDAATGAALTVSMVRPVTILWPRALTSNGAISAWQEAAVSAEIGGVQLVELLVDVGDQVARGQLLARFDAAPLEAEYAQQKAALAEALARLAEAQANADRATRLRETQALSEIDLIKATTAAQAAQAQVELARARLLSQKLALDHTRVVAPDNGVIASRSALLGAVAAPGTELFRLVRQNRLEWHAELTAAELALVRPGQQAEIRLPDGDTVSGAVRQVAPVLDVNSRTGIAFVALDAGDQRLRAGMFASGSIRLGERAGLALPASAIVQRDGYEYVFLLRAEDRRVLQTKVTTGRRLEGQIEILDGLSEHAEVVASGGAFLSDGDRVRIVPRQNAPRDLGAAS